MQVIESLVFMPHDDTFVLHRVRHREGLQYTRSILTDTVTDRHEAVFRIQHAVYLMLADFHLLLEIIFFPRSLVQRRIPGVELPDGSFRRVYLI